MSAMSVGCKGIALSEMIAGWSSMRGHRVLTLVWGGVHLISHGRGGVSLI
jgi:hypothetical protein